MKIWMCEKWNHRTIWKVTREVPIWKIQDKKAEDRNNDQVVPESE